MTQNDLVEKLKYYRDSLEFQIEFYTNMCNFTKGFPKPDTYNRCSIKLEAFQIEANSFYHFFPELKIR